MTKSSKKILVYADFLSHTAGIGNDMRMVLESLDELNIEYEFKKSNSKKTARVFEFLWLLVAGPRQSLNYDLVFSPHVLPRLFDVPHLVRIHDIFPLTNPEWFKFFSRVYFRLALWSQKKSFMLFDSNSSYIEFRKYFGELNSKKYSVMFCEIRNFSLSDFCGDCLACKSRESISQSIFALAVGTIEPRKNYNHLLDLWERVNENKNSEIPLYIVGSKGWKSRVLMRRFKETPNVIWLEKVCDSSLGWLYSKAQLFVSASLAEGFNLPVKEALAFGTPAVISDIPVHLELYSDQAALFRLDSPQSFIDKVEFVMKSKTSKKAKISTKNISQGSNLLVLRNAIESIIEP